MREIKSNHLEEFKNVKQTNETLLSVHYKSLIPYRLGFLSPFLILFIMTVIGLYVPSKTVVVYELIVGLVVMALLFGRSWYLWSRSMVLITNIRVIYLVQQSLFKRARSEAYLCDICQVGEKVSGFNQTLFKYGNVLVQTEAELWIEDIERPNEVAEAIFKALGPNKHKDIQALPNRFWKNKENRG
jgi:uncharacterized membrane protein